EDYRQMQNSNVTKVTISPNNGSPNFNSITEQISESKQDMEIDTSLPKEVIPEKIPQEIKCPTSNPAIHNQKRVTGGSRSHKKKGIDELKHELFNPPSKSDGLSSINHNNVSEISEMARPRKITYDSIDEASQHLAQLCNKAIDAKNRANRANQKEILCWCLY
ncbi:14236_t:CDS:2, partial [Racocetra persica]